jgi:pilus assembly protein CpaE
MSLPTTVLLVTKQEAIAEAVADALHGNERFAMASLCVDLDDLREHLTHAHASAVLVDIDPDPGPLLRQIEPLVARFTETRFVLLANEFGSDLMLEAMQVGARHLLLKSAIKAELAGVLARLLPANGHTSSGDGTVITMLSGSGGCGATTLAFNLAHELALASRRESLLIDLDWYYGAIAPYLGLQGHYGIGDLLARDSHIDGTLVRSTAVAFSTNLHVLLSPVSINSLHSEAINNQNLSKVLYACKQAYAHTVIDAPRVSRQVAATLAGASAVVLIVFQLTVKDIHIVRSVRAALFERGIPENRVVLVANRYDKHSSVTLNEAQDALGGQPLRLVANDYRTAVYNINFGRPLSETAPSSLLRRDIKQLVDSLRLAQVQMANVEGS